MRKEWVKVVDLVLEDQKKLKTDSLVVVNTKDRDFDKLMEIYETARLSLLNEINKMKEEINGLYGYDMINSVTSRIKSPQSILNKLKKKNYEPNYKNLVEMIDDIAGVRIVCPFKEDIFVIKSIIGEMEDIKIIQEKDYIKSPKESGYSAYHLIVEQRIEFEGKELFVKVEIQIRTMAMDFWAAAEHKMKYKSIKKLSKADSKRLSLYAKAINLLDDKIMKLYRKNVLY